MPAPTDHIGLRIAAARKAKRLTQADLARASYLSLSEIKKIEQARRTPSDNALESIAAALGVDATRLERGHTGTERRVHAALSTISQSIAGYDIDVMVPRRGLLELRAAISEAVNWRLGAQYGLIARHVPDLLADTLALLHTTDGAERQQAARLVAAAARAADALAYKYGARDLSARLIELMRWADGHLGDPLLTMCVAYVRTETFFQARAHTAGLRALEAAVDAAPACGTAEAKACRGALHMRAAVIAGRSEDAAAAELHLAEARRLGDAVPEGSYLGTAFGPESVRIHEVSVAVSLGPDHVDRAFAVAESWSPSVDLPAERRSGFWIELARAQLWGGRMNDAFDSLRTARAIAPQHTREHPWARETAGTLLRLRRTDEESLTRFAAWTGAV